VAPYLYSSLPPSCDRCVCAIDSVRVMDSVRAHIAPPLINDVELTLHLMYVIVIAQAASLCCEPQGHAPFLIELSPISHVSLPVYRYLLALVDDSPTIRKMARILIADVLKKTPTLAHNHFLEVVFLLNSCVAVWRRARHREASSEGHLGMSDCSAVQQAKLTGSSPEARARRFVIYKVRCAHLQASQDAGLMKGALLPACGLPV
jgi:hypothetical protein